MFYQDTDKVKQKSKPFSRKELKEIERRDQLLAGLENNKPLPNALVKSTEIEENKRGRAEAIKFSMNDWPAWLTIQKEEKKQTNLEKRSPAKSKNEVIILIHT